METTRFSRLALLTLAALPVLAALAMLAPAPARAQGGPAPTYLPLIVRPALAAIEFATGVNPETGEPIAPGTRFPSGTDLLYVAYRLEGLQGRQYRLDFTYADGETLTGTTRTAPGNAFRNWTSYCITTGGSCTSGRVPLDPGTYTARLYVDGQLFSEGQAVIQ